MPQDMAPSVGDSWSPNFGVSPYSLGGTSGILVQKARSKVSQGGILGIWGIFKEPSTQRGEREL